MTAETGWPDPIVRAVKAAAEQVGLALGNLRLMETLRGQSIRDSLTGLYNRRYLEESLAREIDRARRRGIPVAVLMLDVDHFKRFNDTHGHEAGDAVLANVGEVLKRLSRGEDVACRYGGEEFVLVLPECPTDVASRRAEEIREAVRQLPLRVRGDSIEGITVSIGVAGFPDHGDDGPTVVAAADAALYRAKAEGRDRVVTANRPLPRPADEPITTPVTGTRG
jgi:diguanylate cyclase (GGDEF)-like protein